MIISIYNEKGRESKEGALKAEYNDIKKDDKIESETEKSETDPTCCYIADPCDGYVDPCGCQVDLGCC